MCNVDDYLLAPWFTMHIKRAAVFLCCSNVTISVFGTTQ